MVRFHTLPVEVVVMVMAHCSSPHDIFSLIKADPRVLACFIDNRKQALNPHVGQLMTRCGGSICTTSLLAAHLRHARQYQACLRSNTKGDAELIMRPIILQWVARQPQSNQLSYQASLSTLCVFSTLATEIQWVLPTYAKYKRYGPFPPDEEECELHLSITEHQQYWNTACRFESYVQAFFHQEETLFRKDLSLRRLVFLTGTTGGISRDAVDSFYRFVKCIHCHHSTMLKNVERYLASINMQRTNDMTPIDAFIQETRLRPLRVCQMPEWDKYLYYLTSEGLGMFLRLQSMALEDQSEFVFSTMDSIIASPHSASCIIGGMGYNHMDTDEEDVWIRWVFCQQAFGG